MTLELASRLIETERELTVKVERLADMTGSKEGRRKAARLLHRLEQQTAYLRDFIQAEIEARR